MNLVGTRHTEFSSGLGVARHDGSFFFVFIRLSSGADGHVSGTVDYDIFGEPVTETGVFASSSGSSGGISALVFAYAGKPYDPVTGLYDYGFRDYTPTLARFTTVDPIRDGSNWYAYCNSDPVNYVDAWGFLERTLTDEEKGFAILILGTEIDGTTIDYDNITIIDDVPPEARLYNLGSNLNLTNEQKENVVNDMRDPSRGASLPNDPPSKGGTLYLSSQTTFTKARVVHEIFHQWQWANNPDNLGKAVNDQINASINGSDPYDYNSNNIGQITSLSDITTIEGQAQYIEDFAKGYLQGVKNNNKFLPETKEQAEVLYNSGVRSKAVCEVRNS